MMKAEERGKKSPDFGIAGQLGDSGVKVEQAGSSDSFDKGFQPQPPTPYPPPPIPTPCLLLSHLLNHKEDICLFITLSGALFSMLFLRRLLFPSPPPPPLPKMGTTTLYPLGRCNMHKVVLAYLILFFDCPNSHHRSPYGC